MGRYWIETNHLGLTSDLVLYHLVEDDAGNRERVRLGLLESADVPAELLGELAQVLDIRADAFNPAAECVATYDRTRGTFGR